MSQEIIPEALSGPVNWTEPYRGDQASGLARFERRRLAAREILGRNSSSVAVYITSLIGSPLSGSMAKSPPPNSRISAGGHCSGAAGPLAPGGIPEPCTPMESTGICCWPSTDIGPLK